MSNMRNKFSPEEDACRENLCLVDWFNNHRLFAPIGYIPPAEAEANYYAAIETLDMTA